MWIDHTLMAVYDRFSAGFTNARPVPCSIQMLDQSSVSFHLPLFIDALLTGFCRCSNGQWCCMQENIQKNKNRVSECLASEFGGGGALNSLNTPWLNADFSRNRKSGLEICGVDCSDYKDISGSLFSLLWRTQRSLRVMICLVIPFDVALIVHTSHI